MTSLTTLFGLVPMAFMATEGMGQMFAPIGQAVIGGLTTSTILTLALTPTLYAWFDDMGLWSRAVRRRALELARGGPGARSEPVPAGAPARRVVPDPGN
jgi:hydrophobic/amphiphilic exporter-1 (mainly G- bacteria), HAE1 family